MHDNEQEVNTALVQSLLKEQCPQWADLELSPILSSGTDNALFRLGDTYVVRIPRIEWSPGSVSSGINKEYLWVPQLAQHLKTPISEPVFKGTPNKAYPWPWSITKWNDGHNPEFEKENEYDKLAVDLAHFLNELHSIKLPEAGPFSRRGVPLKELDGETKEALKALEDDIDTKPLALLWEKLSNIPCWDKSPVWMHGDLLPGNVLMTWSIKCTHLVKQLFSFSPTLFQIGLDSHNQDMNASDSSYKTWKYNSAHPVALHIVLNSVAIEPAPA